MLFSRPPPLALYIHFPWCIQKCPYCDFNSHKLKQDLPEHEYIDILVRDLENDSQYIKNRSVHTIFMGGGTPSLFSGTAIERLLARIKDIIPVCKDAEITIEANPGTVDQDHFDGYVQAGINRLSLGVQSFENGKLHTLGRIHDDAQALNAVAIAEKSKFRNINIDLMFGLPNQTCSEALRDLTTAINCEVQHISWYQLTLEPNTPFYHTPPAIPDEDVIIDMQNQGIKLLAEHGYQQYEISAFCKQQNTCRHNVNYWEFGDYLGIGAGAHSKLTDMVNHQIIRNNKIKHPKHYRQAANFVADSKIISENAIAFEFMLNSLRLKKKIGFELWRERTGLQINTLLPLLDKGRNKQLIEYDDDHFWLTELGWRFYNDTVSLFL